MNNEQNNTENKDSNLISAMNHVAENTSMSVSPMQKSDDAPADKQVLIRATEHDRDRWKNASNKVGVTLSSWIRDALNKEAASVLDCPHPGHQVRYYPWATICLECGQRFPVVQ
jgi:predicted DNA binding CopG/RHH family protein